MDTESAKLSKERFINTAQRVNALTSGWSDTVEPVLLQEYKGSLMQYPAPSAQIGQKITQIILESSNPQTLLARVARALGEIFQVDACLIVAGVDLAATLQKAFWCADEYPPRLSGNQGQLLEELTLKDCFTSIEPLGISDLQGFNHSKDYSWRWEVPPARAILKICTRFQSSRNGMIVLGRSHPHEWTAQEKELLSIAAESVAIAISQVQLTQQALAATRHQALLNQLSLGIRSPLNLDEILQIAIAGTAQALQVERGLLLLLNDGNPLFKSKRRRSKFLPKTKVVVAAEWREETTERAKPATEQGKTQLNQSFWLSESSLCQQAFRAAPEALKFTDGRDTPNVAVVNESLSLFDWKTMPALLIVPLFASPNNVPPATVLGFLVLQHSQPRPWHTDEIELVKWVSTQVSAAIIQNQTLRQVQSLAEDRTAQLQQSLEVQAKLYEKTRQQMDQLQQLSLLKEEFISSMSHELRTPLTTMSLAIRMLRQPELSLERREKYLKILEQQCNQEIELINDLLSLQRLEADKSQIQPQKIDLVLLINELAQSFTEKWSDKRLTLTVDNPAHSLMLNTDADSLNRILMELLTNAGKYSNPNTTVHLKVTHQVQPTLNQVVLTLTNTGRGISPTDLTHIFDKFRRGEGVTQQAVQGTGLGLALVKCLVEHLNGTIDVESRPSKTSQTSLISFTLTLPKNWV